MALVSESTQKLKKGVNRLKLAAVIVSLLGITLFGYFIYAVGFHQIYVGVTRFGFAGFGVILALYFVRILVRAYAWKLSVHEPYFLTMRDAIGAVVIGEAMSSTIPLGILISGTAKAVVVRKRLPLVAGLSSVTTENLFYSLITSVFLILGATVFLRNFAVDESVVVMLDGLIAVVGGLVVLGFIMVLRQWHFVSESCEWLYRKGHFTRYLENLRLDARLCENLIYDFYRSYPRRFLPICVFESVYHLMGIAEVWFILGRLTGDYNGLLTPFLLESVSRLVTIFFKLIPFVIGVDEAGARYVGSTVMLASGVAITLAIIRKGRMLFWTAVGALLILKRGLSIREIRNIRRGDEI